MLIVYEKKILMFTRIPLIAGSIRNVEHPKNIINLDNRDKEEVYRILRKEEKESISKVKKVNKYIFSM